VTQAKKPINWKPDFHFEFPEAPRSSWTALKLRLDAGPWPASRPLVQLRGFDDRPEKPRRIAPGPPFIDPACPAWSRRFAFNREITPDPVAPGVPLAILDGFERLPLVSGIKLRGLDLRLASVDSSPYADKLFGFKMRKISC